MKKSCDIIRSPRISFSLKLADYFKSSELNKDNLPTQNHKEPYFIYHTWNINKGLYVYGVNCFVLVVI